MLEIENCLNKKQMILTTTHQIPGYSIDKYKGLVNANQVIGVNIISEWIASITDVIGGTSGTFRRKLDTVYSDVLSALSAKPRRLVQMLLLE